MRNYLLLASVMAMVCGGAMAQDPSSQPAAKMSPQQQRKTLDELPARMLKDVASAKLGHYQAIEIGPDALPVMIQVMQSNRSPDYARMWAATAMAQIGGEGAAEALIKAAADPNANLRNTAVYYGLKLKNEKFDNAINDLALSGNAPELTGWAVVGYLKWREKIPDNLYREATRGGESNVRSGVAQVCNTLPDRSQLPLLRKLVADDVPSVRMPAARALGKIGDNSPETIDALFKGLEFESEQAREVLVTVLMRLSGQSSAKLAYVAAQSYDENVKALARWKQWWSENRSKFPTSQPAGN